MRSGRSVRRRTKAGCRIGILAAAALGAALPASVPAHPRRPLPQNPAVTITVGPSTRQLPHSFLGLSMEYPELPLFERNIPVFERVLSLLHVAGDGPQVVRIGGDSADWTFWTPGPQPLPSYAFVVTPKWFRRAARVVRDLRLRLLMDLNLASSSAPMSARLARAALSRLPRGSIAGFEIGNEPDDYGGDYSVQDYVSDFRTYAGAVARFAPKSVRFLGPASSATDLPWLAGVAQGDRYVLGVLSGHEYPLNACVPPSSPAYPTIGRLLSESNSAGMARAVAPAFGVARQGGVPFRLDELNSVTCGGLPGVSNTFATALWAPDAIFELLGRGLDALNVHIRPTTINGPFVITRRGLSVRPLLYGLILFARTVGAGAALVHLNVHASRGVHLKAWGVRLPGGTLRVLLINKDSRSLSVDLRVPPRGIGTLERLLAPSVSASSGVTLAGQHLGRDGKWRGRQAVEAVLPSLTGYHLELRGLSAALFSVSLP